MKLGNQVVRKAFYGVMILLMVLAAFGTWDVSSARAQGSLNGATVSLKVDSASFGTGDRVVVRVNISNPTNSQVRILKWLTPALGVEASLFNVTRDGKAVAYLGKLVKRAAPTESDYLTIAPGGSVTSDVNLADYYDLSASGNYSVKYNVASANLYGSEQAQSTDSLASEAVDLFVEGRTTRVLQEVIPNVVTGTNGFFGCSASQQTDLINARNAASTYAADDVAYFAANKQGERYVTWFGVYDSARYNLVKTHFTNVQYAVDTANPMTFDCTCTDPGVYAYVYPDSPFNIYLCGAFWNAPTTGTDSKAGTLIHEVTHFTVVGGTDDYAYGQTAAKALAISNPAQAVMNADSHEYFSENNPPLEVSSTTFTDVPDTYWAYDFIERLYNAGITSGCSTSPMMYCPTASVSRAQMAIFILRGMHGSAYVPPAATGTVFSDVSTSTFGAAWIEQFAAEGITSGCGGGRYCPDDLVTRAQMAIFLLKGEHGSSYVPPVATGMFSDVPVGSFAADWIEQLANEGVTSGCGGGNYCPNSYVLRDQMAVFLVRAFSLP
ncbi:MAG: S-layer homology domain-containing protein [Anaerolineales bacterium]|uniref:M35 family metallo-endopeptidase n=1 Tax=Candidatus Villigracilis affinis TaxID=3140682 RepID=UPI002A1B6CA8|nr:S-layer homology domain-containing protein [Anaerolineales bacterium]MBL0346416.1 S-layer homology domain-containing protein [Anaerolineales bacterium]